MLDRINLLLLDAYTRLRREEGQGVAEYAIVLGFVVAVAVVLTSTTGLQSTLKGLYANITSGL
ncbi:MAG TPA: hypothetical protein VFB25_00585 [Gaiellaceae bacterium]|nr:hypothetical protein [Gaiellaceae bacterium]